MIANHHCVIMFSSFRKGPSHLFVVLAHYYKFVQKARNKIMNPREMRLNEEHMMRPNDAETMNSDNIIICIFLSVRLPQDLLMLTGHKRRILHVPKLIDLGLVFPSRESHRVWDAQVPSRNCLRWGYLSHSKATSRSGTPGYIELQKRLAKPQETSPSQPGVSKSSSFFTHLNL